MSDLCPSMSVRIRRLYWVTFPFQGSSSRQTPVTTVICFSSQGLPSTLQFAVELDADPGEPACTYIYVGLSTAISVQIFEDSINLFGPGWIQYSFYVTRRFSINSTSEPGSVGGGGTLARADVITFC